MENYRMERVNRIWNHPYYQECLEKISTCEQDRAFCRHTPEHFLDVARLTYIMILEQNTNPKQALSLNKELIYAAALLHDIGRFRQYEEGISHDEASVEIASKLLPECGFTEEEAAVITGMIASHRKKAETQDLNAYFYKADKLSRNCFACPAEKECNWAQEKKNLEIRF